MAYNIWEWEKFKILLRKIRTSEWDPDFKDHISTLIMEGRNPYINPDDDERNGDKFPDLLRYRDDLASQSRSDKNIHVNEFIKFILREDEETRAKLCVVPSEPLQTVDHELFQLHEKYRQLSRKYIYPYTFRQDAEPFDFFRKLFKYKYYEATVRLFINALLEYINQDSFCLEEPLRKISEKKEVAKQENTEKDISEQSKKDLEQKKEKPDYLIFYNDMPLGVVETKNARCLTRKSIIQCMKQLLALHKKEQEVKEQSGHLLGIVTDALHFIFIRLLRDKTFVFESEFFGIKVHTANTWNNLDSIATFIRGSCERIKDTKRGKPY